MTNENVLREALNGNKECCYMLGEKYYYGRGVKKDAETARGWYAEAAKLGHAAAQYMYGYILCITARGENDLRKGVKVLKKSASKLHLGAMLLLARNYFYGVGVEKNEKKAFRVWKRAAEIGCPEAKYYLGLCYDKGVSVKRDVIKAKRYLFDALEGGYDASRPVLLRSGYPVAA